MVGYVKNPSQIASGYRSGVSLQDEAQSMLVDLVEQLEAGTVDHYGRDRYQAVQYTIAGGGPGADVTFILDSDGDPREAFLTYMEPDGKACVPLPDWAMVKLYKAYRAFDRRSET